MASRKSKQPKAELIAASGGKGQGKTGDKFTDEQREEIKYFVRRAIYSDLGITAAHLSRALKEHRFDVSYQLARFYMLQVQREDAEAERIRAEHPDILAQRSEHRKLRENVFSAAMRAEQYAQANRALDALAALDGVATSKVSVSVTGEKGGPIEFTDVTQMSDAALRAKLAALKASMAQAATEATDADVDGGEETDAENASQDASTAD